MKIFSQRLRQERIAVGLSQKEIADKLGISQNTYKGYELIGCISGREPSLNMVVQIADVLDVSVDYLLGRDEYHKI